MIIPIVVSKTKKEEMSPLGGVLGLVFLIILSLDRKVEVNLGLQDKVSDLMSAVTLSSDDGAPMVLVILVG
jgi:hypothetical protein